MTSGIASQGQDLDLVFASGSGGAATGWKVAGADLNTRYAPYTSGAKARVVGLAIAGSDMSNRFAPNAGAFPSVSVSPSTLSASTTTQGTLTTGACTATIAGGTSPYTETWTFVSGDSSITPVSPHATSTTFTGSVTYGQTKSAQYSCHVADHLGNPVSSSNVTVTLTSTFTAPTVTLSPAGASQAINTYFTGGTAYQTVTPTVSGGVGPFTYSWSNLTPSGLNWTAASLTTSTLNLSYAYAKSANIALNDTWQLVVTDTGSGETASPVSGVYRIIFTATKPT